MPAFSYHKAIQALNFFARQNSDCTIDKLRVLKLVFFADRYHLRKYGRTVTNDRYYAMRLGPVPSATKEMVDLTLIDSRERHYAAEYLAKGKGTNSLRSIADLDLDVLSETDLEALRFSWRVFGHRTDVVSKTHSYPEWKRHEALLRTESRVEMDYLDFLLDPPGDVDPCFALSEDARQALKEHLAEVGAVNSLWR